MLAGCTGQPLSAQSQEPSVAELEARIAALEEQLAALSAGGSQGTAGIDPQSQRFQVAAAVYFMDNAGLHDLDVRLNEEGVIEPGDAGRIERLARLLGAAPWPAEMQSTVAQLDTALAAYAEALTNDDLEAAKPLATEVHEVGHDLSHAVEAWLAGSGGDHHAEDDDQDHGEAGESGEDGGEAGDDHDDGEAHEEEDDHAEGEQ
jgi:hypothetical protein